VAKSAQNYEPDFPVPSCVQEPPLRFNNQLSLIANRLRKDGEVYRNKKISTRLIFFKSVGFSVLTLRGCKFGCKAILKALTSLKLRWAPTALLEDVKVDGFEVLWALFLTGNVRPEHFCEVTSYVRMGHLKAVYLLIERQRRNFGFISTHETLQTRLTL
jgi:hypothetical protein